MARLTDDQLNWTLSLNAGGIQGTINNLNQELSTLERTNQGLAKDMREVEKEMKKQEREMDKLAKEGKQDTEQYKSLTRAMEDNRKKLSELKKNIQDNNKAIANNQQALQQQQQSLKTNEMTMSQLQQRAAQLKRQLDVTSAAANPKEFKRLASELKNVNSRMQDLNNKAGIAASSSGGIGSLISAFNPAMLGVMALGGVMANAATTIVDFQKANSNLAGILGTTTDKITDLTDSAKRLGSTTSFSASQVTELQTELAKLGFTQQEIMAATDSVLSLSSATGATLAESASLAGATLRSFGLDASEMSRVASVLAVSTTKSALSFESLNNGMSIVAPVAAAAGFSLEETTALLGGLANAGFDASSAATATRNIMLYLADNSSKLSQALGKPVKTLDDLTSGLKDLQDRGVGVAEMLELTDKRAVAAFATFVNNADSVSLLKDSLTDCEDGLNDMVATMTDNVDGAIKGLGSAWEGLMLAFSNSQGVMKTVIDGLTSFVQWITRAVTSVEQLAKNSANEKVANANKMRTKDIKAEREELEKLIKAEEEHGRTAEEARKIAADNRQFSLEGQKYDLEREKAYREEQIALFQKYAAQAKKTEGENIWTTWEDVRKATGLTQTQLDQWADELGLSGGALWGDIFDGMSAKFIEASGDIEAELVRVQSRLSVYAEQAAEVPVTAAEVSDKELKKEYEDALKSLKDIYDKRAAMIKQRYVDQEIDEDSMNDLLLANTEDMLNAQISLMKKYGKETGEIEEKVADTRIKYMNAKDKRAIKDMEDEIKRQEAEADAAVKAAIDETKAIEDALKKREELRKQYGLISLQEQYDAEMIMLKKNLDLKLITEEEYEQMRAKTRLRYAKEYTDKASQLADNLASFVSSKHQAESDSLEAQKARELQAAGDNAEKREAIEERYEQAALDLKKKQANADAAISIAQTTISGAQAVMTAFAQLGPIAGAVSAAMITATTAMQIKSIMEQRDAILAQTLSKSTSSSSASGKGEIVLKNGYATGGYTGNGGKYEPAGVVHRGEYVVAQEEMHNPSLMPLIRRIERARNSRNHGATSNHGFADGGMTSAADNQIAAVVSELANQIQILKATTLRAEVNYFEFEKAAKQVASYRSSALKK